MPVETTALIMIGLQQLPAAAAAASVAKPTAELVKNFVERLFGPSVDYAGQGIKTWVEQRTRRGQQVVVDAAAMLNATQREPQQVPGRILLPLIEKASLEDDPDMRRQWAALLANAASDSDKVLPGFTDILGQLLPIQARILDWMHGRYRDPTRLAGPAGSRHATERDVRDEFHISHHRYSILIADLHRLQLVDGTRSTYGFGGEMGEAGPTEYAAIQLTDFGLAFVEACTPPHEFT